MNLEAANTSKSATLHFTVIVALLLFLVTIVLSIVLEVEIVASGRGRVVPNVGVQSIQSEYSGKIFKIESENGLAVLKGEVLLEIDSTDSVTKLLSIEDEIDRLMVGSARVECLIDWVDLLSGPHFSPELTTTLSSKYKGDLNRDHEIYRKQDSLLEAELGELRALHLERTTRLIASKQLEEVTNASLKGAEVVELSSQERVEAVEQLFDRNLASRLAYLDVVDSFNHAKDQRLVFEKELQYKQANIAALQAEYDRELAMRKRDLIRQYTDIDSKLFLLNQQKIAITRRISNSKIVAPIGGIVEQLELKTIGGIIQEGVELMQIVPSNKYLEIEAIISNAEIGFIQVGQPVNIKLDAFPPEIYGSIRGTLTKIATNSSQLGNDSWGFAIQVSPEKDVIEFQGKFHGIKSGMTANVDIITGKRSIISYFFAPILKTLQNSMGEQ
jgi:hemolysin D